MKTEKWLFMKYLLSAIWRLFFYPTKFDKFKDEKISDDQTVSGAQSTGVYRRSIFKIRPNILIGLKKLRLRPKDRSRLFIHLIF